MYRASTCVALALIAAALAFLPPSPGTRDDDLRAFGAKVVRSLQTANWVEFRSLCDGHVYFLSFVRADEGDKAKGPHRLNPAEHLLLHRQRIPQDARDSMLFWDTKSFEWDRDDAKSPIAKTMFATLCSKYRDTAGAYPAGLSVSGAARSNDIPLSGPGMTGKVASNAQWRIGFVLVGGKWKVGTVALGMH